jgi:hypothetical protein
MKSELLEGVQSTPSYVKFTGKFRDLIPQGYKFHKLFARNYRCYNKECGGAHSGDKLWIWQHLGGYVEIKDFFDDTFRFVEEIIDGTYHRWKKRIATPFREYDANWLILNRKTGEIITYDSHITTRREMYFSDDAEVLNEYCDTYREANISENMIQEILRLHNAGMIEVCLDKRPK